MAAVADVPFALFIANITVPAVLASFQYPPSLRCPFAFKNVTFNKTLID